MRYMDFLDPSKRRGHTIRLFLGYVLMGIAILLGTIILVYQANGYNIDSKTHSVFQKGLVFVDAKPEQATIYVNGEQQRSQTDARLSLAAGQYDLRLTRDGYRDWKRSFNLDGGTIERFSYPVLYPKDIKTDQAAVYADKPALATQSPDRRWLLLQQPGSLTTFELRDLNRTDETGIPLELPADMLGFPGGTHKAVSWAADNVNVLLEHRSEALLEYIMVNRENPAASINVNRLLAVAPASAELRDKRPDQLYIYETAGGLVRIADLKARTVSAPVIEGALTYTSYGPDILLYITATGAPEGKVQARIKSGDENLTLRELSAAPDGLYFADIAQFEDHWYYVVASSPENKVIVFRDPVELSTRPASLGISPYAVLRMDGIRRIAFSDNSRFLMAQGGQDFAVFDADDRQSYHFKVEEPLGPNTLATWMDGFRMTLPAENGVNVFDFDGSNRHNLVMAAPDLPVFFDKDYTRMYSFMPGSLVPRFVLQRSVLKVTP
jgi:hypothetical protein